MPAARPETSSNARFPTTRWSQVVAAGDRAGPAVREALAELCSAYWYPLSAFVRRKGHPPDEAVGVSERTPFVHPAARPAPLLALLDLPQSKDNPMTSLISRVVSCLRGRVPGAAIPDRSFRPSTDPLEERRVPSHVPTPAHVVVVMEENHGFSEIIGSPDAPYINSLASDKHAALFTQSFALTHPSQPNYLLLFSGSNQGVTDDSQPTTFTTPNLASELLAKHKTFAGYSEDLPSVGFTGATSGVHGYAAKHSPWTNWQGTGPNQLPATVNQPFTAFPTEFKKLPTVSFVTPNLQHDMHDGTVAEGDAWLQQNLNAYVQWAKKHNSLLILTTDEDDHLSNNQITTLFIGAGVKHGQYSESINHFSVLRTIEAMYHLPALGGAASVSPITDVWTGHR
jgi:acid phosphatase